MSGCSGGACGLPTGVAMARYYQNPFAAGMRARGDGGAVPARYRGAIGNPDAYVGQAAQSTTRAPCPYGFTWTLTRDGWRCVPIAPAPSPRAAAIPGYYVLVTRWDDPDLGGPYSSAQAAAIVQQIMQVAGPGDSWTVTTLTCSQSGMGVAAIWQKAPGRQWMRKV